MNIMGRRKCPQKQHRGSRKTNEGHEQPSSPTGYRGICCPEPSCRGPTALSKGPSALSLIFPMAWGWTDLLGAHRTYHRPMSFGPQPLSRAGMARDTGKPENSGLDQAGSWCVCGLSKRQALQRISLLLLYKQPFLSFTFVVLLICIRTLPFL